MSHPGASHKSISIADQTRTRPERNTFPDHLPRERVVIDPPTACECCGGNRLRKLGEDVTRTLESVPRQWKVVETVREKFSCRDCEARADGGCACRKQDAKEAGRRQRSLLLHGRW